MDVRNELLTQVNRFKKWATTYPPDQRSGEWECDYEHWNTLWRAFLEFVDGVPFALWSVEERISVLYVIARDNEMEYLVREIKDRSAELLLDVSDAALEIGEADAKWQLATQLGYLAKNTARQETLLLQFANDGHEYVRRRSLQSLARIRSSETEKLALEAWSRPDESQQWARMNALWALYQIESRKLESLLACVEMDGRPYLMEFAAKIRRGEVEV